MAISPRIVKGDVIDGRFEVERILGAGGMGTVVCAMHLQLRERVAIKFLNAECAQDGEARARFLREARLSARLRNQHVARLMDFGVCEDGTPILVMEYLAGTDLAKRLAEGRLSVDDTVEYLLHACEALAEAHAQGLIHRDLKPSNLFLTRSPDGAPMVKVLDFGISKAVAGGADDSAVSLPITDKFAVIGSPGYMSPEQVCGRPLDVRADTWSLGVLLYEMLTGEAPFERPSVAEIFAAVLNKDPAPLRELRPELPQELEVVAKWSLAKAPQDRCPSVADFAEALVAAAPTPERRVRSDRIRRFLRSPPSDLTSPQGVVAEQQSTTLATAWRRSRRRTSTRSRRGVSVLTVFLAFLGVVGGAVYAGWRTRPEAAVLTEHEGTEAVSSTAQAGKPQAAAVGPAPAEPPDAAAAGSGRAASSATVVVSAAPVASPHAATPPPVAARKRVWNAGAASRPAGPAPSAPKAVGGVATGRVDDPLKGWDPLLE